MRDSKSLEMLRSEISEAYDRFLKREKGVNYYEKVIVMDEVEEKSYTFYTKYVWDRVKQRYRVSHDTSAEVEIESIDDSRTYEYVGLEDNIRMQDSYYAYAGEGKQKVV